MLQQDVFFGQVAEHEGHFAFVGGVVEDPADELVHRRDACAAGDQGDVVVLVGRPGVFGDRAFEVETLRRFHRVDMLGHRAVRVALNDKVDVAAGI